MNLVNMACKKGDIVEVLHLDGFPSEYADMLTLNERYTVAHSSTKHGTMLQLLVNGETVFVLKSRLAPVSTVGTNEVDDFAENSDAVPAPLSLMAESVEKRKELAEWVNPSLTPSKAEVALMSLGVPMGDVSHAAKRKGIPVHSGVLMYFPDAIRAVAVASRIGNEQHNAGQPLHWDRSKSGDELDALSRHLMQVGTVDSDGVRHSTKVAWRALANLQKEIEAAGEELKDV